MIGNGFDLNLGWHTRFSDFANSSWWPLQRKPPYCELGRYLNKCLDLEGWFDLESTLREYATTVSSEDPKDASFFAELRSSLSDYLKNEAAKAIDHNSLAIRVLKAVIDNGYFSSIYSFNYTNLKNIARAAYSHTTFDYKHVHGCLDENSIIVGIDDKVNVRKGYEFLRKVYSSYYSSHHIRYDLQDCDEVVFFGHSLGDIDYYYFEDFFSKQCNCNERSDSKRITVITKNDRSRVQILEQLRKMNAGETERLINDNDFQILMTDYSSSPAWGHFFVHLEKDSLKSHYKNLDKMASMI